MQMGIENRRLDCLSINEKKFFVNGHLSHPYSCIPEFGPLGEPVDPMQKWLRLNYSFARI